MSSDKQQAQQLLNHLAPDQIAAVVHLMEVMLDPVARSIAMAPLEDEEINSATAFHMKRSCGSTVEVSPVKKTVIWAGNLQAQLAAIDREECGAHSSRNRRLPDRWIRRHQEASTSP